jgi:hypothetical protein
MAMPANSTRLFRMISHRSDRTSSSLAGVKETFVALVECCNQTSQCSTQSVEFANKKVRRELWVTTKPTLSELANHRVSQAEPRITKSRHRPDAVRWSTSCAALTHTLAKFPSRYATEGLEAFPSDQPRQFSKAKAKHSFPLRQSPLAILPRLYRLRFLGRPMYHNLG